MPYSVLKGNELSSHENTWRNLKYIVLNGKKKKQSDPIIMSIISRVVSPTTSKVHHTTWFSVSLGEDLLVY